MHDRAFPVAAPSPAGFQTPCLVVFSTVDNREKTYKTQIYSFQTVNSFNFKL